MKLEIKVPAMGESISAATIGAFLKANHVDVRADDELLELETDKVNQVLYAEQAGTLNWNVIEGDSVKIGQVIGFIDVKESAAKENLSPKSKGSESKSPESVPLPKTAPKEAQGQPAKEVLSPEKEENMPPPLLNPPESASSARFTKQQFLSELKEEPLAEVDSHKTAFREISSPLEKSAKEETRKKMSKIRRVISAKLVEVLQQTAMLTTFNEVDMSKIMTLRESYKEDFAKHYHVRLGLMPFFVKAAVSAMKAFPDINAYVDGEDIVYRNYYDIGVAVGTDKGLFVPVVRECDRLSFADIEQSIERHANKAREGGLVPDDLQGGGFTITNGGVYGSLLSTPILNPPQSAILGMHKIMKRAVVVNDQIVIRPMMYLALSYDHRIVDGKEAVSFLIHLKNALEDPSRLLIGI